MRKGQFYMIDAFFAAAILFLGISLVFSDYVRTPETGQARLTIEDVATRLYDTEINDLSNDYINDNFDILSEDKTPIQQAHLWVWNASQGCSWCLANATALMDSLVTELVPQQHAVVVIVNGTEVYDRPISKEAEFQLVNKQVVITDVNATKLIGPEMAEVRVWG